jgi:plasmid maintenance system killer protein
LRHAEHVFRGDAAFIEDRRGDHDWLRAFFVDDVRCRNIPPDLASRLFRHLQMLDGASGVGG